QMRTPARWVWIAAAASLALSAGPGPALAGAGGPGRDTPRQSQPDNGFAQTGPWNTPLPADVPLAPDSAAVVASIQQDQLTHSGVWGLNTDTYSTPVFYAGPDTPVQSWTYSDCLDM